MSFAYQIRWRLVYLDGRKLDESLEGSTIKECWPDPFGLQLIDPSGMAVIDITIPPGHKPIFYRRRSITQLADGEFGEPQLDATIFGYGREGDSDFQANLCIWRNGQAAHCPDEHIDKTAIEMLLQD